MKKKLFLLLLSTIINNSLFTQQVIFKLGDNIIDYLKENTPYYLSIGTTLLNTPDGRIDFLKFQEKTVETDTKFLVQGTWIFGVLQNDNNKNSLLYDMDGDGTLDIEYDKLFIPPWILSKSKYTKTSRNNKDFSQLLDDILEMFNNDKDPYETELGVTFLNNLSSNVTNVNSVNRDLYYAMYQYYRLSDQPHMALLIIANLAITYEERFGKVHDLIWLHTTETLINLGNYKAALTSINVLLKNNPDFIPVKIYSWRYETDSIKKAKKYIELEKNHKNHWMFKKEFS